MYTDTTRPNHLIQEVIDNSVDEALAGFASQLTLTLHQDGLIEVSDDGRGMPVDQHKNEKVSGVELILTASMRAENFPIRIISTQADCMGSVCLWSTRCQKRSK